MKKPFIIRGLKSILLERLELVRKAIMLYRGDPLMLNNFYQNYNTVKLLPLRQEARRKMIDKTIDERKKYLWNYWLIYGIRFRLLVLEILSLFNQFTWPNENHFIRFFQRIGIFNVLNNGHPFVKTKIYRIV